MQPNKNNIRTQVYIMIAVIIAGFIAGIYLVAAGALPSQYTLILGENVPEIEVPEGYRITVFAKDIAAPRYGVIHPETGVLLISERGAGRIIALPDADQDGIADKTVVVMDKLVSPTGLAFYENWLYVAEGNQIVRFQVGADLKGQNSEVIVPDLPGGRNKNEVDPISHALLIHNNELYVTVGASCADCEQTDSRRAAILVYNVDGSNERVFARGLYYSLGLAINPINGELWATNQGRPEFSQDVPESVYRLQNGDDAGFPTCHAGDLPDLKLGNAQSCDSVVKPLLQLEPQSNIAGMWFYTQPGEYQNDLLVVLHGGVRNDGEQVGLSILRFDIDPATGTPLSTEAHDFVTGWRVSEEPGDLVGRPFGIVQAPDGTIYITDDTAQAIYRLVDERS